MTPPGVSIVVEWDNLRLAGTPRTRAMLERLGQELRAAGGPTFEVLLVHDGRPGDVAEAERILSPTGADVRIVSAPRSDYYELKNAGARAARGELVVFLDCDIVPEPGWIAEMLAPFANPAVEVVAGSPYLQPTGLWGKSLALVSVFPLRDAEGRRSRNGARADRLARSG
jgi:cellulose synthase/poly-beta-1,6-N-acetylglucosamine synthase-like glycosyltransferase